MLKNKKIVILLLCVIMLAQASSAMAVTFSDVNRENNSAWAYDYIMDLANKGIIQGYPDGTYKPESNVTYLETLKLLFGIMNPSREEINSSVAKYKSFITSVNTPDWAHETAAVALNRGVVSESEYRNAHNADMIRVGTNKVINRLDVAVFTARALELSPKTSATLTYKDADKISATNSALIAALIDTGVLHKDGRDGSFFPNEPIKRSEMAKMIKVAYDWVKNNPLQSGVETKTETGTVISYNPIGERNFLVYKNSAGNTVSALLNSSTKITDRAGRTVALKDVSNFTNATLTIKYKTIGSERIATEVNFSTDGSATDGEYTFKSTRTSNSRYYVQVLNSNGTTQEFETRYNYAKNGNTNIFLEDIKLNAKVKLKVVNGIIDEITLVTAQTGEYRVKSISDYSYNREIVLTSGNSSQETRVKVAADRDLVIVRGNQVIKFSDLKVGDMIDVDSKYSASRIVIYSNGGSYTTSTYTFDRISGGRIYVRNNATGRYEDLYLSRTVRYLDGLTEYNLRSGDQIELSISGNEVFEIRKGYSYGTTDNYTFNSISQGKIYATNNRTKLQESYYLPYNVTYRDGLSSSNLRYGDQIVLKISGNEVYEISKSNEYSWNSGKVYFTYRDGLFSYRDSYSGRDSYLRLDDSYSNIKVYVNNKLSNRYSLPASGDARLVYNNAGNVTEIYYETVGSYDTYRSGEVVSIYDGFNGRYYIEIRYADGGRGTYTTTNYYEKNAYSVGNRVNVTLNSNGDIVRIEK